jgi:hypothetical protein
MPKIPGTGVAKLATKAIKKAVGPTLKNGEVQAKLQELDGMFNKMRQISSKTKEMFSGIDRLSEDSNQVARTAQDIIQSISYRNRVKV